MSARPYNLQLNIFNLYYQLLKRPWNSVVCATKTKLKTNKLFHTIIDEMRNYAIYKFTIKTLKLRNVDMHISHVLLF